MYLKTYLIEIKYQLKGLGILNFLPIIGVYVLIPLANYISFRVYRDKNLFLENILKTNQLFLPVLTVFCTFFLLEHCIEEDGHELLYLRHRWKLPHVMTIYIFFQMILIPLYFVYAVWFPDIWWLYLKLAVVNLFYHMAVYCLSYMFGKITPAIVMLSLLSLAAVLESVYGVTHYTYYDVFLLSGVEFLLKLIPYAFFIPVFAVIGSVQNHYFIEHYSS